jgi:hypothetical protein
MTPFLGAHNRLVGWNPKILCHLQKNSPPDPTLNEFNPFHILTLYFSDTFQYYLPIYSYVSEAVSSLQVLQPKFWMHFLSPHVCYMSDPLHCPWFDYLNTYIKKCKFFSLSLWDLSSICLLISLSSVQIFYSVSYSNNVNIRTTFDWQINFHIHVNNRSHYSFAYLNCYTFTQKPGR